jgi:hypothetical protein
MTPKLASWDAFICSTAPTTWKGGRPGRGADPDDVGAHLEQVVHGELREDANGVEREVRHAELGGDQPTTAVVHQEGTSDTMAKGRCSRSCDSWDVCTSSVARYTRHASCTGAVATGEALHPVPEADVRERVAAVVAMETAGHSACSATGGRLGRAASSVSAPVCPLRRAPISPYRCMASSLLFACACRSDPILFAKPAGIACMVKANDSCTRDRMKN